MMAAHHVDSFIGVLYISWNLHIDQKRCSLDWHFRLVSLNFLHDFLFTLYMLSLLHNPLLRQQGNFLHLFFTVNRTVLLGQGIVITLFSWRHHDFVITLRYNLLEHGPCFLDRSHILIFWLLILRRLSFINFWKIGKIFFVIIRVLRFLPFNGSPANLEAWLRCFLGLRDWSLVGNASLFVHFII